MVERKNYKRAAWIRAHDTTSAHVLIAVLSKGSLARTSQMECDRHKKGKTRLADTDQHLAAVVYGRVRKGGKKLP